MLLKLAVSQILIFIITGTFQQEPDLIIKSTKIIDSIGSTRIVAHTCWSRKNQNVFLKNLTSKYNVGVFSKIGLHQTSQVYIIDLKCNDSGNILKQAEKLHLFHSSTRWILFGKIDQMPDLYFGIDSGIFLINPESDKVTTIYKCATSDRNLSTEFLQDDFSIRKRKSLMGRLVKISIVLTDPDSINHLTDYKKGRTDALSKLNYLLINTLMDYLNASRIFMVRRTWGTKNQTTGLYPEESLIGDLQRGIVDLAGTPSFFLPDRVSIVDYLAATTPTYMKFVFRAPPLSYVTNVFTLPFDSTVWHYCFIMVAIVVVFIYGIVKWEWRETRLRKIIEKKSDALRDNIFDVIMMEIGAITQQGTDVEPRSYAGRIITIFTFLTLMFLYVSYSANIVALLQSTTDSITNLEELLNSRIKLGVEDIIYARYYFENAQDPIRKAIYAQKVAPKGQKANFMKAEEGMRRVQQGFFAFHVELNTAYKLMSDMFQEGEKCGLKEIEYENFIEPWLTMQKNSTYKEVMKIGMRRLHESGIQNREFRKFYTRKPQCLSKGSNFGSVGMIDCYSAFLIFAVGIFLALFLLFSEYAFKKYSSN